MTGLDRIGRIINKPQVFNQKQTPHPQGGAKYEQKEGLFVKNGPVSVQGGTVAQMMGRGFMMGLKTEGCAA